MSATKLKNIFAIYLDPKVFAIFLLGISSGLPLLLTGSTLTMWLTEVGVDKTTVGLFAIVAIPYSLKFLWAPLVDFLPIPILTNLLGRRKAWLLITQIMLIISIIFLAYSAPEYNLSVTALMCFCVAFSSATQDIVVDAYRLETLENEKQGPGAAAYVIGYRIGMLISGAQALFLAQEYDWSTVYTIMAGIIIITMTYSLFLPEPKLNIKNVFYSKEALMRRKEKVIPIIFRRTILSPLVDFTKKKHWLVILFFVILYKLNISFAGHMSPAFYLELGFSKSEIATIVKSFGLVATITGSLIGGAMSYKIGLHRTLWIGGFLQMLSCFMYIIQEYFGDSAIALIFTISIEDLSSGIGTSALLTYVSQLCTNRLYTATQYSIISALSSFGRVILSSGSGFAAEMFGWTYFFAFSALLSIPGLIVLAYLTYYNKPQKVIND